MTATNKDAARKMLIGDFAVGCDLFNVSILIICVRNHSVALVSLRTFRMLGQTQVNCISNGLVLHSVQEQGSFSYQLCGM